MRGRFLLAAALFAAAAIPGACGGDDAGPDDEGDRAAVPFTVLLRPEFVQGVVDGATTGVLVTIEDEAPTDVPVELDATFDGAAVSVTPTSIIAGQVAEVMFAVDLEADGAPVEIVVTGRRGGFEASANRSTTGFSWEDDRGEYARTLLDLFVPWLAANEPDLDITTETAWDGSFVAPGLLVVSHYLFLSEDWELGLAWHVMVAPDDWAEIYLRPRAELAPTWAFRLASQQAALQDGTVDIAAVNPPVEIVR